MLKMILISLLLLFSGPFTRANTSYSEETLDDFMTVLGLGGAGAVIGLSTLSFVDRPSEELKNIMVGGSIGIIAGVAVVAWEQATKSNVMYTFSPKSGENLTTFERKLWHEECHAALQTKDLQQKLISFKINF